MKVTVNGSAKEFSGEMKVSGLLESLGLRPGATVVERNGEIVQRQSYDNVDIKEGDILELVRFVGGG